MNGKHSIWVVVGLIVGFALIMGAYSPSDAAAAEKKMRLTISGGTIGGSSNLVANAIAGVAKNYLDINSTVITYPTVAQVDAVLDGIADIATGLPDVAQDAYEGTGPYKKRGPSPHLRAWLFRYATVMQLFVTKESKLKNFRDMAGKRISTGKKGFSADHNFHRVCDVLGLSYDKDFKIMYFGHKAAGAAIIAGKIDAYVVVTPMPQPTFAEVDLTHPLTLLPFSEQDAKTVGKALPYWDVVTVPPNWYHMSEPTLTLQLPAFNVCTTELPEDVAYKLVKNYIEHPKYLGYFHKMCQTVVENGDVKRWVETLGGIPYHAGCVRYFKEAGWKVRPDRIPPEAK